MYVLNRTSTHTMATLLLTGVCIAALVLALGKANAYRLHAKLEQLGLVCIAEALTNGEEVLDVQPPFCDPITLTWTESAANPYRGIQAEIVATQAAVWQLDSLLGPVVSAILALTAAPWLLRFVRTQAGRFRKGKYTELTTPDP